MNRSSPNPPPTSAAAPPTGRWVVLAMLGFGVALVGALWTYWEFYTRPFRPLQYAIAEQFPHSSPRVVGGKHKSHKPGSPNVLRIVVQVPAEDFDPTQDFDRAKQRCLEMARIADRLGMLHNYEQLEVHLIQRIPEQSERHWVSSHSIDEWDLMLTGQMSPASPERSAPQHQNQ